MSRAQKVVCGDAVTAELSSRAVSKPHLGMAELHVVDRVQQASERNSVGREAWGGVAAVQLTLDCAVVCRCMPARVRVTEVQSLLPSCVRGEMQVL